MAAKPEDFKVGELFKKSPDKPKQDLMKGGLPPRRDEIRTEQLAKKGSKGIQRDKKTGGILVRKKNNKQVRPFRDVPPPIKWNDRPIKGKQISPRYKSDWVDDGETLEYDDNQTKFSGETSGYIEKPKYNEEELKKSLDVKVDELIKKKKPEKGPFVKQKIYNDLLAKYEALVKVSEDFRQKWNTALSEIESLKSRIAELEVQLDLAKLQEASAQNETQVANTRFTTLLSDFQNAVIAGSKEGVERVSLNAQVRGLQAQKKTLQQLLEVQKAITNQLTSQVSGVAAETAAAASGLTPFTGNEAYWGVIKDKPADWTGFDASWTTSRKNPQSGKGGFIKIQNLRDDGKKITKVKLTVTDDGGIGSIMGFGSDSSLKPSATASIAQGATQEIPFFFRKSIGGKNSPKPKNYGNKARDYSGKFKIEIEFEDGTGNQKIEGLTWKIRKNKKG
jgi:outer membrane murein-binding lipoprotein Lpp